MKKHILIIAAALLVAAAPLGAQGKSEAKDIRKEAKAAAKQLRKDGYSILGVGELESQLTLYLTKVRGGCTQIIGTADGCMSINLGKVTALNNAANEYATLSGGLVKGRLTSSVIGISEQQADDLVGAYERLVYKNIQGELVSPLVVYRKTRDGFDVRAYCLVDYDSSGIAQQAAFHRALESSGLAQEFGSQLADWINEGFIGTGLERQ